MSFYKMQEQLRAQGWTVEFNYWCCQSCAWADIQNRFENGEIESTDKVLFCHEQDVEQEAQYDTCWSCGGDCEVEEECSSCNGYGHYDSDGDFEDCHACEGVGHVYLTCDECGGTGYSKTSDVRRIGPDDITGCHFAFGDAEELKKVVPLIMECGVRINWNESQSTRPELSW
jgi:hypothetical protein